MFATNGVGITSNGNLHRSEWKPVNNSEDTLPAAQLIQRKNELNELFEKKFQYQKNKTQEWSLPNPQEIFKEYYQLPELQELKKRLNEVKSKLNNYGIEAWSNHTRRKDPAGEIPWKLKTEIKAEFVTVAWCKFFEVVNRFPIVKKPKINSLHLCEAPGAFIAALNHYLSTKYKDNYEQIQWKWLSTTLNPYYEGNPLTKMITDDRFLLQTLDHWVFHEDFTGNIIDVKNISNLQKYCENYFEDDVHLITADGSIDCVSAPDCQEEFVDNLNFAEILTALSILSEGGCFVVKLFTLFEANSVCKMFLLNCVFESVSIFKPATSKRGNSEIYVICMGFKKNTENLKETLEVFKTKLTPNETMLPIYPLKDIPKDFLLQHEICQRLFMNLQIKAIKNNIFTYEVKTRYDTQYAHCLRSEVCAEYMKRYKVEPIPREQTMLYGCEEMPTSEKIMMYKGSHSEREMLKATTKEEQVFKLQSNLNDLEKALQRKFGVVFDEDLSKNKETYKTFLRIYKGLPIPYIQNSLFMSVSVLFMRMKFQEIFDFDTLWSSSPHCTFNNEKILNFDFETSKDFTPLQQKFFVDLIDEVITNKPESLIFKDFPFVTHYSVSILRYLSLNLYSSLIIQTDPCFEISLKTLNTNFDFENLKELREKLANDQSILCIMDIQKLHRNAFSKALIEYNNLLVVHNSNKILSPKQ